MPIEVACDSCGREIHARDEYAGRIVKCPQCAASVAIPGGSALPAEPTGAGPPAAQPHREPAISVEEFFERTPVLDFRLSFKSVLLLCAQVSVAMALINVTIGFCVWVAYLLVSGP